MRRLCFLALCLAASPPTLAGGLLDFGHSEWRGVLLSPVSSISPSGLVTIPAATQRDQSQVSEVLPETAHAESLAESSASTINPHKDQK